MIVRSKWIKSFYCAFQVSYVKSLEWFLMMCFLFVFSAILEYAFVSYLVFKQREEERNRVAMRKKHDEVRE